MRIVIDLQGAQSTGSRNRGIGRYSLSLAQGIIRNRGEHEVYLALNGLFANTIEPIRAAFDNLLPQEHIRVWHAPDPVNNLSSDNNWRRKTAELVREAFLASLKPDIVLIASLFEGLTDDAVTSIGNLSLTIPTAAVLYDLIPLINRLPYLENPVVEAWYENKLDHLRRADLLLAISESSRQEAIRYLSFPPEQAINISTAADPQFLPQQISKQKEAEIRERYHLQRPFVMYTGGIDHRKNIEGLIRAYAKLSKALRTKHQLAIICSIQPSSRTALEVLAKQQGLAAGELVLTGYVPENDLITLYNLCKTFVFPSWHEGFGLPALEAMCCGRAVISANTSSLPEVIGCDDALFDPHSDESIAHKLTQVLSDDSFRQRLEQHGLKQARRFSWDVSAKAAIAAIEAWHSSQTTTSPVSFATDRRPRLAYVSPLPPERSGISDYSTELLPELARHYDIEVIIAQDSISDPWIKANCPVRNVEWFKAHTNRYDRVLYHFGNSYFHQHMFELLAEVPGVVILHDFFLSGIVAHMDFTGYRPGCWTRELYKSHGYASVQQRFSTRDSSKIIWRYPCNLSVLKNALGVIAHSENSRQLSRQWYGTPAGNSCSTIPLLRVPPHDTDRVAARRSLGINNSDFLICSFGMVANTKLNHRLLDAWLASMLAQDKNCKLVFVGEHHGGYGAQLLEAITRSGLQNRIQITGWADTNKFHHYLAAADISVQLRTLSRGETSAAVLDCMNYSLPTIINANGSMADLPDDAVWKLPDEFDDGQLVEALETLWHDEVYRQKLGSRAKEIVRTRHSPRICSDLYTMSIEFMYQKASTDINALVESLTKVEPTAEAVDVWKNLANSISMSIPTQHPFHQILIDVSELICRDGRSGIQRVVRAILRELLNNPPSNYRIEPVYATPDQGYHYARRFTLRFLDCPDSDLTDEPIEFCAGDLFLGLDFRPEVVLRQKNFYQQLRDYGVKVQFVVYDILPILQPNNFMFGASDWIQRWMQTISLFDSAICISRTVATNVLDWLKENGEERHRPFNIGHFHLGSDIDASSPTKGLPANASEILNQLESHPSFLMVGTIEPRKSHAQTLAAFENLWKRGIVANLVFVGKEGWMVDTLIDKLRTHTQLGKQLFWLDDISDEYLEKIYASSTCLIAASVGEGFGLPLIEAAQHKLPIIARDIPVFREVAGDSAYYFSGLEAENLADAIKDWLTLDKDGNTPQPDAIPLLTWAQSTQQLLNVMLNDNGMTPWMSDGRYRYHLGSDVRLFTQVGKREGINILTTGVSGYLIFGPYLSLTAGRYQIRIYGQIRQLGHSPAYADASMQSGSSVLSSQVLTSLSTEGLVAEMEAFVTTSVTDFEVRVWVDADSDLSISKLEILPETVFNKQPLLSVSGTFINKSTKESVM